MRRGDAVGAFAARDEGGRLSDRLPGADGGIDGAGNFFSARAKRAVESFVRIIHRNAICSLTIGV